MELFENPIYQNVAACLATFVYVKTVVGINDYTVAKKWVSMDVSLPMVHMAAGCWCLFWPLFSTDHWTWQLNVAVPVVYSIQLFVKGAIIQDPNDPDVKALSVTGRPMELCEGPMIFTLLMMYCGLYQFQTDVGVYLMAAATFGSGMAMLVEKKLPLGSFQPPPFRRSKTLSGSLFYFVSTIVGIHILRAALGLSEPLPMTHVLAVAVVSTVAETVSGQWEDLIMPPAVMAVLNKLEQS